VEPYPASKGCVRLEPFAARLIHDNSIEGVTEIVIDGTWTNPNKAAEEWPQKAQRGRRPQPQPLMEPEDAEVAEASGVG
jgi:hypothetical protein